MLSTIPYGLIGLTALALIVMLGLIKFWPWSFSLDGIWLKRLAYYRKRRALYRRFKKREDDITYSTFFMSWVAPQTALDLASKQYMQIVELLYHEVKALNKEYQQYFTRKLVYNPPN